MRPRWSLEQEWRGRSHDRIERRRIAEIAGAHGECYALGLTSAVQRGLPVGGVIETGGRLHAWLRLPVADDLGDLTMVICHDELIPSRRALLPPDEDLPASPRFAA